MHMGLDACHWMVETMGYSAGAARCSIIVLQTATEPAPATRQLEGMPGRAGDPCSQPGGPSRPCRRFSGGGPPRRVCDRKGRAPVSGNSRIFDLLSSEGVYS